ncbi:hypothetical protein P5V15_014749 [Pogonomyrmex californicus]
MHKAGKGNTNADALSRNLIVRDTQINSIERDKEEREYSKEEKEQITYEYHNAPLGGHQDATHTINRIKLTHNWHGLTKDHIAKVLPEEQVKQKT